MKNRNRKMNKKCSCCGKNIKITLYKDKNYRGGHYFGKIPISSKKEWERALKSNTHKAKIGKMTIEVLNENPKPYKYLEYRECPKCYWRK